MLTRESVIDQIAALKKEAADYLPDDKPYKRLAKRVEYLECILAYLDNNPSESWLKSEVERAKKRLARIEEDFDRWCNANRSEALLYDNPRTRYDSIMGTAKLKRHLKNAKYILQM